MSKILDVTPISDSAELPFKKGSLKFIQDAWREALADLIIGFIGSSYNPATVYVLRGCVNTGTSPVITTSAGVIFYGGEVYDVDAASFTPTTGNVAVVKLIITQYTTDADPVELTDTSIVNVHNIRKMQIVQGASGSGIVNYTAVAFVSLTIFPKFTLTANKTGSHTDNIAQLAGTYPNIDLYVASPDTTHKCLTAGTMHVGDVDPDEGTTVSVTFAAAVETDNYVPVVVIVGSSGNPRYDSVLFNVINSSMSTTGFDVHFQELQGVVQSLDIYYIVFKL